MAAIDYNRYELLKTTSGYYNQMPFIEIPESQSDKYIEWNINNSRTDRLSQQYYNSPLYGFFILYANSKYLTEWDIPDGEIIRIPFPFEKVKEDYESILKSLA